jgi:hypothetical protein
MSLEGLQAILDKEEIVATQRANDLMERPEFVDESYKRHVRTYVPLGRQADEGQSVAGFERQVVRQVRQGGAVRGYITAEYGYGKTSTALYLWNRARAENLLAVPPFQLNKLTDLIVSSFGWVRYEVGRTRPNLLDEAQSQYESLMERSAESLAQRYGMDLPAAQRMVRDRPDILDLTPADYIRFFEQMTHLSQQAGFDGLLILADEVQQYIEPEIKSGIKDPISPLFDVIGAILTRRNHLNFGLVLVIPPKELALLRDQRGDLVHRVLQVSLDLASVYDREFPSRLWHRLAKEFDFEEHRDRIVSHECLEALGQISARNDLSDGPRTVINAFRRMTRRYIELGHPETEPYSPYHLVEDFIGGNIQYDSPKKIPRIVSQALSHNLVRGHPERERAVKWAAAFPNEGIPRSLQERLGLTTAFDDLAQSALGDLVISVGDVHNRGFTLRGLDQVVVETDWLTTTIREFWRTYYETADTTRQRALDAFFNLLTTKIFPDNQWTVVERISGGLTRNMGLVLEGSFNSFNRRFPERRVHVRVMWEEEPIKDAAPLGEVVIQIRLLRHLDWPEEKRRYHTEPVQINYEARQVELTLNLMYRGEEAVSPRLEGIVGPIVSPYKLTPLLLLTMHQVIDEKRENNLIPKVDDQQIQYGFQPELLDNIFRELFNNAVGAPVEAAEERIVEVALLQLLEAMYPDYDTLIRVSNWSSSLQKYTNALKHLETAHERQGQIVFEGIKEDVAGLFTLSNTGLDTFISNFPSLIEVTRDFPTRREAEQGIRGAVRFKLHYLEQKVKSWLQEAPDIEKVKVAGRSFEIHRMLSNEVYRRADELGYREKEIDAILDLMEERGLIEKDPRRGVLREAVTQAPSVDELAADVKAWQADIATLHGAFSESSQLRQWQEEAQKAQTMVEEKLRVKPDDEQLIRLRRAVQAYQRQLAAFAKERHQLLQGEATKLINRLPAPDRRQGERLDTPVQGSVDYVQQVNDLRVRVLRQYTALASELEKLQRAFQSTHASLKADELSLPSLIRLATDLKAHERQAEDLKDRRNEFTDRFNEFAAWTNLVERGSELLEDIQTLGELVREQREQFRRLSQEINGHLSANKLDALPDAPTYEMRLNEIAGAVRQLRTEATDRYNTLQERYQRALVDGLGFPRDRLWMPHQYNPVAPDYSYMRLASEVQSKLRGVCEQLNRVIGKEQESVRSTLRSPLMGTMPSDERESLARRGEELEQQLTALSGQLNSNFEHLDDTEVINDFPQEGEGQFHHLLQQLGQVRDRLGELHPRVESLNSVLQALELTGPEEQLIKVCPSENEVAEVSELRQMAKRLTEDDFWAALRGLHAKRRLRITVEPVRYD